MTLRSIIILLLLSSSAYVLGQNNVPLGGGTISGNFQLDAQTYTEDTLIGAPDVPEKFLLNTYTNIMYTKGNFTAGVRYEGYFNSMQGIDTRYDGQGFPYRYARYQKDNFDITIGNFYEQFGNGLILRSYEDKNLGYDNAFDGARVIYNIGTGIQLTGMIGKQRLFWEPGEGIVRGLDGNIVLNEAISSLSEKQTIVSLGGSFVSKYQTDQDPIYNLPQNVSAFAGRFNIQRGGINLSGEYTHKYNDPSADNNFIYKDGNAAILNFSYSRKGFGFLLGAKRVDNMSFRSDRNENINNLNINYLPAISKTHTYGMAAMYPYATQPNGEFGIQGEILYKIPKNSTLGGKYGTNIALSYSRINSINKTALNDTTPIGTDGTLGYEADFFDIGDEVFFEEVSLEVNRKFSKKWKATAIYQNLTYNYEVLRGIPEHETVYANVAILDITYKPSRRHAIRFETQALFTEQDMGDWITGLIEYTISPKWFFVVSDQYNYGNYDSDKQIHYYSVSMGMIKGASRIQVSYGKQREGIICIGGVCRSVPAANGLTLSITSSF